MQYAYIVGWKPGEPAVYDVRFGRKALKDLKGLAQPMRERVLGKLRQLARDPDAAGLDTRALKGGQGFRLRVGDYRILYTRDDRIRILAIQRIGHRRDIYR